MLILTRRLGESVKIGDEITITVLGVKSHQARIGVDAPKDIAVHREEVYERIQSERKADARRAGSEINSGQRVPLALCRDVVED